MTCEGQFFSSDECEEYISTTKEDLFQIQDCREGCLDSSGCDKDSKIIMIHPSLLNTTVYYPKSNGQLILIILLAIA